MSTNSDTMFSVTDDGRLTETPRCTRTSPCSEADCLVCNGPASDHHVRNLNNDLETTPTPKKPSKPLAPPNHILSLLTEEFKQVLIDEQEEDIKALLTQYYLFEKTCPDFFKYDRTEINKLIHDARQLLANLSKPTAPPDHWIPYLTEYLKEYIQKQDTVQLKCLTDMYQKFKTKQWTIGTDYHEYNQAELEQLSRTAAKILDAYNHSHALAMQKIAPETNTENLSTWETRPQDIQVPRVHTTMDKDSNKESVKHLQDKGNSVKVKASPPEILQATQTSPTKTEEKSEITTLTGKHALNQVDDKLPAQVYHNKDMDHNQLPQLITIDPKVKALHKLFTLNQGKPRTSSDLITESNPDVIQLHETSIHSAFWEHLIIFGINISPKFARKFTADLPSTPIQPALKPPWNLGRIGVH